MKDNEISTISDDFSKYINIKRDEYRLEFENGEKDYPKRDKKELDKFLDKSFGELEISKE